MLGCTTNTTINTDKHNAHSCVFLCVVESQSKQSFWQKNSRFVVFCPSQWQCMSTDTHRQMSHKRIGLLQLARWASHFEMVKHDDPLRYVKTVVKCSPSRGVVQIHQLTDFVNKIWLGWSESTQDVSSAEGYVFVPTDPFRAAEKITEGKAQTRFNKQQQNKQTDLLRNDQNISAFQLCQWESLSRKKINTSKRSCWKTHTHAHKHECVPFLLARSSFRGLSKNMASEEDAFERQEKQSSLRAPDLPLLQTCCWLDPGKGPPEGPHRDQHRPPGACLKICRTSLLERNWELGVH